MRRRRAIRGVGIGLAMVMVGAEASAQGEPTEQPPPLEIRPPPPPEGPPLPPDWSPPPAPPEETPVAPAVSAPPPLPVETGPRFGDAGVVVITADSSIGISSTEFSASDARFVSASFSPGFDYFVVRHFSVGLSLDADYGSSRGYGADNSLVETSTTTISGSVRFGLDLPLGAAVSFYPRLSLGVESVHRESRVIQGNSLSIAGNPIGMPSETLQGPYVNVFAPLLFHPTRHFFVGAGPGLFHEFGKAQGAPDVGGERTTIDARMVIGGWWGGADAAGAGATPVEATAVPATPSRHAPRFGDRDELVLSGELAAGVFHTTYGGVSSTSTNYNVSPSFDYFVASHVSLGLGGSLSHSSVEGPRPDGPRVQSDVNSLSVIGRFGVDIPFSPAFSLYPRASLAVGRTSYDETSGADELKYATINVTGGVYAPLLVHFAPHAFVGLGPFVSHDLSDHVEEGSSNNLATTVGVRLIVGGWLSTQ